MVWSLTASVWHQKLKGFELQGAEPLVKVSGGFVPEPMTRGSALDPTGGSAPTTPL